MKKCCPLSGAQSLPDPLVMQTAELLKDKKITTMMYQQSCRTLKVNHEAMLWTHN
jgi:hypothetical protein